MVLEMALMCYVEQLSQIANTFIPSPFKLDKVAQQLITDKMLSIINYVDLDDWRVKCIHIAPLKVNKSFLHMTVMSVIRLSWQSGTFYDHFTGLTIISVEQPPFQLDFLKVWKYKKFLLSIPLIGHTIHMMDDIRFEKSKKTFPDE